MFLFWKKNRTNFRILRKREVFSAFSPFKNNRINKFLQVVFCHNCYIKEEENILHERLIIYVIYELIFYFFFVGCGEFDGK